MRFTIAILLVFCFNTLEASKSVGPIGNIILNSIQSCDEKSVQNDVYLSVETKNLDDKGTKSMSASLATKIPIDNSIDVEIEVRKQESGSWKLIYSFKGNYCENIQKYLSRVYQKIRAEIKPSIPVPCPITPGNYTLTGFQAATKNIGLPSVFYGRILFKAWIKKAGKTLGCIYGEGDSQAPSSPK